MLGLAKDFIQNNNLNASNFQIHISIAMAIITNKYFQITHKYCLCVETSLVTNLNRNYNREGITYFSSFTRQEILKLL